MVASTLQSLWSSSAASQSCLSATSIVAAIVLCQHDQQVPRNVSAQILKEQAFKGFVDTLAKIFSTL
jgi:hypothetical protein